MGIDAGSLLVLLAGGVVVSASNTASPVVALAEADEDCPACAGTVSPRAFSLAKCSCEKRSVARKKSVALLRLDFNFSVASLQGIRQSVPSKKSKFRRGPLVETTPPARALNSSWPSVQRQALAALALVVQA